VADDNLFAIRLVTPERVLVSGITTEVVLRTREGDITFLAGSAPLVGTVEPGVVRVTGTGEAEGEVRRVAVHGGFVQVEQHVTPEGDAETEALEGSATATRVTILAAVAELSEEIDVERARTAHDAAEAKVGELAGAAAGRTTGEDDEIDPDLAEAQAALVRAEVRLEATEAVVTAAASTA
jgi:F-type H+-transporting ATPase subunit epsilon